MEASANTVFWLRRALDAIVERLEAVKQIADDYRRGVGNAEHRESEARQREDEAIAEQSRLTHATERKRSAENKKNLCVQWVIGTGTWAAVLAASIYAGIAMSQLHAMREQTKASIVAFQTDERAWIGFEIGGTIKFTVGQSFSVPTQIVNTGKTPARNVHGNVVVGVFGPTDTLNFNYSSTENAHLYIKAGTLLPQGGKEDGIARSLPAVRHGPSKAEPIILTVPMASQLQNGDSFVVIHGRLDYYDIFGVEHWTKFCRYVSHPEQISEQCTRYNDTDNNSPN